jgi:hypothetical protein
MSPRALGGGPLVGDQLVRFVYLDETGTGDPQIEPYVVVAGVMIDADRQWKDVENHLIDLADAFATPDDRLQFCSMPMSYSREAGANSKKSIRGKRGMMP